MQLPDKMDPLPSQETNRACGPGRQGGFHGLALDHAARGPSPIQRRFAAPQRRPKPFERLQYAFNNTDATIRIMNNSVHGDSAYALIESYMTAGVELVNNVIVQAGAGSCVAIGSAAHHHNLFHAPQGTVGISLDTTEIDADPEWLALPAGEHDPDECAINAASPATDAGADLSALFHSSFNGLTRPQGAGWDMGAYEAPE